MRRLNIWLALIILVAAILLFLSLRGIDWALVINTIRSLSPTYALLAIAIGQIPMFLRAARWQMLLQAQSPVSYPNTFWAVAAGYFGNNFLPARGGEILRSYIVHTRSQLSLSYALATALAERAADAVALVLIGSAMLFLAPSALAWMNLARGSFAVIGMLGLAALALAPALDAPLTGLLAKWPRLVRILHQVTLGVRSLHDIRRLTTFAAFTALIWALDAIATSTLAFSLHIAMPPPVAMLLIVGLSLSSAFPSTPGYVGVYQFVSVSLLKLFGISPSLAIAFILTTQAITYVVTGILGLLAITRFTPLNWQAFRAQSQPSQIQN